MAISQIPALPWELIFGRPSVGRSTPESNGNFTDCCSDSSYFIPTLRAQYLADKVFADLPPCLMAILQIPVKFLFHSFSKSSSFGRPCPDRSSPIQWWFYRFLFLQLNTLRAYHLADQVLTDLPPPIKWQFHRLLWNSYFIPTLRAHIWQTKWWQIYPLSNGNFTDCCSDSSYFIPTLRAHHLADQVLTDLPPHQMAISQIPALTAHYFKSSTFDRPGLGRSTPTSDGNFTDSFEIYISFLLWELNIWLTRSWQIYLPLSNGNFTDSCSTLKAHICQTKCWQINPPPTNGNFTDVGRSTSPSNSNFTDFCSTLRAHIKQTPLSNGDFTDSCFDSSLVWELNIWQTNSWQI